MRRWKELYPQYGYRLTKAYEGIPETVAELERRGARLGVLSNKFDAGVQEVVDVYLPGLFAVEHGEATTFRASPTPPGCCAASRAGVGSRAAPLRGRFDGRRGRSPQCRHLRRRRHLGLSRSRAAACGGGRFGDRRPACAARLARVAANCNKLPGRTAVMARKSTTFVVVSWALVALCAGFIFFMSSNTDTGLNDGLGLFSRIFQDLKALQAQLLGPGVDVLSSIAHFCEYTMFGAFWRMRCAATCRCVARASSPSPVPACTVRERRGSTNCSCPSACATRWIGSWTPPALLSGQGLAYLQLRRKGREGKEQPGEGSTYGGGMKVGEWSDEARMALRCILHRCFARIGEQLLRRGLQRFGQTEDDGEARVGRAVLDAV